MRAIAFTFLLLLLSTGYNFAANDYQIKIKIEGYQEKELYLAYHYGDKQYIKDTVQVNPDGFFVFEGDEPMTGGVYLVVMAPDNNYFQILVSDEEQHFTIKTTAGNPTQNITVNGSEDNRLFYEYLNFLASKRPLADDLRAQAGKAEDSNQEEQKRLQEKLNAIDEEVKQFQEKLVAENPGTLTAAIVKANMPMDMSGMEGDDQEQQMKRWRYVQKHYFDNIDLGDPRILRTPFLFQRVDYFINKLQVQHPDTLSQAIDYVLEKMRPAEETFKYYLIHFLNYYAKSDIVGMDAVYVHLAETYYATGQAPWTDEEQLEKIIDNAQSLKPLLIGKTAPNIKMQKKDGSQIALHDVDSEYTVLYFWRYDCGHCKESTPHMKEFYENFKDKGVKIFAVCTKYTDEIPECWEYIDENAIQDWIHTVDPYNRSKFGKIYNIKSTPQIFILDRDKEILSKRIGAEQLEEVMNKIIEMKKQVKEKEGKDSSP